MQLSEYLMSEGISAAEFARQVGVTRQQVSLWLRGGAYPSARYVGIIHRVTSGAVEPNDLFPTAA